MYCYTVVLFTTVCASSVNKITFDLKVGSQVKIARSNITLHLKTHTHQAKQYNFITN